MFLDEVELELFIPYTFPTERSVVMSRKFGQAF